MPNCSIRQISPEETYSIRHAVLRQNQPIESCHYPHDFDADTIHVGAFVGEELVSIASYYQEGYEGIPGHLPYRLRGMATLPDYRGKGIGSMLLKAGMIRIGSAKGDVLWCNARTSASDYYDKQNMQQVGEIFDIPPIGLHKRLYKAIPTRELISSGAPWEDVVGYSRAVRVGNIVEVAGTTAVDENGAVQGIDDPGKQTAFILDKIARTLNQAGTCMEDVVRTRMFVTDVEHWEAIGKAHGQFFSKVKPAASMVEVSKLIDSKLLVEIEVTAIVH